MGSVVSEEGYPNKALSIANLLGSGYVLSTLDGMILEVNAIMANMLGYLEEELIGCNLFKQWSEPSKAKGIVKQVRTEKMLRGFMLDMQHKAGSSVVVSIHAHVVDQGGEKVLECIVSDVTPSKPQDNEFLETLQDIAVTSKKSDDANVQESVDMANLISEVVQQYEAEHYKKSPREIQIKIEKGLPIVKGDRDELKKMLTALFENAVDASKKDSLITIEAKQQSLSRTKKEMHLTVEDFGHGMDKDTQVKIFDPFFTTRKQGRGLGLVHTLKVVQAHQGRIHVKTGVGKGSIFKVILPVNL